MLERFYLFRLVLPARKPQEPRLHLLEQSSARMLSKMIIERPGAMVRKNIFWVIANTEQISSDVYYFKVGRELKRHGEKLDKDLREFIPAEIEVANCARCIFDSFNQVIAIENAPGCPSSNTLARYITIILNHFIEDGDHTSFNVEERLFIKSRICKIEFIPDPSDFIHDIQTAYRVLEYKMFFSKLNPIDYTGLLQHPMGSLMTASGADLGYSVLKSFEDTLQSEVLTELANESAAAGNDISAKLQRTESSLPERIYLKKKNSCMFVDVESGDDIGWRLSLARTVRKKHLAIKGKHNVSNA